MTEPLEVADFFCGAGGFSEGFRQRGFDIVFALDDWGPAVRTHKLNHPDAEHEQMDIRELDTPEKIDDVVPDVDVIVGGPPCVNFSTSNKAGKADKTEGLNLIECFLRIVAWKKHKGTLDYWVMENVPNTKKHIKDVYTAEELNLPAEVDDLEVRKKEKFNSADFGAPQRRRRMFYGDYPEPEKTREEGPWRTIKDVFDAIGRPFEDGELVERNGYQVEDPNYGFSLPQEQLTDHFYDTRIARYRWEHAKRKKRDHGYYGKMNFPEDITSPSRTVMATRSMMSREAMIFDVDGSDEEYRLPTVREIACFMAYPITYQFYGSTESKKYRLVGNSVPVKVSGAIAKAIAEEEGMDHTLDIREEPIEGAIEEIDNEDPDDDELKSVELTSPEEKELKEPSKRNENSSFSRHVPHLKKRAFRPELTNKQSDFEKGNIRWDAVLHKGIGEKAHTARPTEGEIREIIERNAIESQRTLDGGSFKSDFEDFNQKLEELLSDLAKNPAEFQEIYVNRGEGERTGPEEALEELKKLVNDCFPKDRYEETEIDIGSIELDDERIPLRILMGYLGCRRIVDRLKETDDPR